VETRILAVEGPSFRSAQGTRSSRAAADAILRANGEPWDAFAPRGPVLPLGTRGAETALHDHERPHHVVLFVFEDVAVPDVLRALDPVLVG